MTHPYAIIYRWTQLHKYRVLRSIAVQFLQMILCQLGDYITDSAKSICIQIYDTASNTIQNISWNDFMGSLDKYHNTSADSLTGIYAKYCPRIISGNKRYQYWKFPYSLYMVMTIRAVRNIK